jgi:hypothetical protein
MLCHCPKVCTGQPASAQVRCFSAATWNVNSQNQHLGLHAARAVLVIAGSIAAADARDARVSFTVSATVNSVARIETQSAPAEFMITDADLRRGYIDVEQPTALTIRSNSASGFAIDLTTVTPVLTSMIVRGLDTEFSLGPEGGTVVQRWQSPHLVNLALQFRLVLAPGLAAGRYPWPMRVAVRPLEAL